MPQRTRTNALRGVAPQECPKCKRPTVAKDYNWRPNGACYRVCKRCHYHKRIAQYAENKRKKQARTAYGLWRKVMGE